MKKTILTMALILSASPLMAAQQTILGGTGHLWGDEKTKINSNFSELYGKLAQALLTTSSPTFVDLTLTSDLNLKDWIYFTSDDDTHYVALAAGNNTANFVLRWPTAAPGGSNYLLNFDADGTGAWTDPSTLGGDDLGSAASSDVVALFGSGSCSGYLKSDGTCDTPSGAAHDAVTLSTDLGNNLLGLSTQQLTLDSQTTNKVFASPNGSTGAPSFRALVAADIPTLNQNTTGTAGGLSGTPNITVGTVTASEYLTSAADGARWAGPINTVAMTATATLGRIAWLTDRYWIANGTNWTTRYFLDSSFMDSAITNGNSTKLISSDQAYDALALKAPLADAVMTGSFALPQGTVPTVDAAGETAVDTTSDQFVFYGGAKRVLSYKRQENFAVKTPVDADDFLLFKAQQAITVTDIHVIAQGGTSISVDVQECDSAGANCATVDAAITADTDGAEDDGTLSNGTIDAGDWVKIVLGAPSGTVNYLAGSIYYTITAD